LKQILEKVLKKRATVEKMQKVEVDVANIIKNLYFDEIFKEEKPLSVFGLDGGMFRGNVMFWGNSNTLK